MLPKIISQHQPKECRLETNDKGSKSIGRRQAISLMGAGLSAVGGLLVLGGGCTKSADQPSGGQPGAGGGQTAPAPAAAGACKDRIVVDEAAATLRKSLQYKEKSDTPAKKCSLCAQFQAAQYGDCGGCKLFAGAVNPEGVCLSFAPKGAPGAAADGGVKKPT